MGIAVRSRSATASFYRVQLTACVVAGVLRLHREETYDLASGATTDEQVSSESARRTFWAIQNHDNLYTQQYLPLSFAKSDITTLLPASENDFAFGRVPLVRSALAGTAAADKNPHLVALQPQCLFATLVQVHDLWGMIARQCYRGTSPADLNDSRPWDVNSKFKQTSDLLRSWEQNVPLDFRWSQWNLRGYKAEHVDLVMCS